eukprot:872938-Pleurochrysis_carterae.AAC.1
MAEAADRLLEVLVTARRATADAGGAQARGRRDAAPTGARAAPKSLRDLPAGSTSKLTQLRSETGAAARRAADAAVLQP